MPNASPDYSNHLVNDFILDESFQQWVLHPDKPTDFFWEQWLRAHPHKAEMVNEAKHVIENLKFPLYRLDEKDADELWIRIQNHDRHQERSASPSFPSRF
ncbi:hypothetical protein [Chryseolinea sp. H1M3-3]|uniref:hypothetical protein n=1 Tax=Chryseolinea sp. H1M3-3 TaxID=3034144 RepID=UPI0023EBF0BC|nr:hypothetical protein [Chryseolinea sp. H1M3-3]